MNRAPITLHQAEHALSHIPNDLPRGDWARIAMALKSEYGEAAFSVFRNWSEGAANYNLRDCRATWNSCKPAGGVGLGSLLYIAKQYGYTLERTEPMTASERAQANADALARQYEREALEQQARIEVEVGYERARQSVNGLLAQTGEVDLNHEYLRRKRITRCYGAMQLAQSLVIPMSDLDGAVWNYQAIYPNGTKRFYPGAKRAGMIHIIGASLEGAKTACICEGWATGVALHEMTEDTVVIAFDVNALKGVALAVRERYPELNIFIACDFDERSQSYPNAGGIGFAKGKEAARAAHGVVIKPAGGFKDFADWWATNAQRSEVAV